MEESTCNPPPKVTLAHFPKLPAYRQRPTFAADKVAGNTDLLCTKKSSRQPTLLPGLFTIYCRHGKILHLSPQFITLLSFLTLIFE